MTVNKARARRARSRRPTWRLIGFALLFLGIWLVGLLWFAKTLPVSVAAPARNDGGYLIAQRLAGAGRQQHHSVVAGNHRVDRCALSGAKTIEAEHLPQHGVRVDGL